MDKYDDLFDDTAPNESVFQDKSALDPLADPDEIIARDDQERELATILNGVNEGYLSTTVSIYGPPGTGKTLTTRRICHAFADRNDDVAVEYVNLKECRSLFSAANEILLEVCGEKKEAYEGLDGVFDALWTALDAYPEWTILLLDEVDHVKHDSNYDPNEFFYRLLRGERKRKQDISLSVWLLSNEILEVDLRLDSRVQSAMSDESVFFPPYDRTALGAILESRIERAFHDGMVPEQAVDFGVTEAARRWGDARKALTLFRQAGETANERGLEWVTKACIEENLETTEREATIKKLLGLPFNHFQVLAAVTGLSKNGEVKQPVTTTEVRDWMQNEEHPEEMYLGERAIREIVTDLETMGLAETWIDSRGRHGRVKQIETTFEPRWVRNAMKPYADSSEYFTAILES